ncbi:endo-1,4-beta-xylanase [Spirochaetia bacterium 38H-sp]|uniref:Beta-xylanase n=1 Tax=Rarispira pelagica TaxID=3141764 RepID=A0ABU9UDV2_9SPIR
MRKRVVLLLLLVGFLFVSCEENMRSLADKNGLLFGVAVRSSDLFDPVASKLIEDNFNIVVTENIMKLENLRPNPRFWNWNPVDDFVEAATEKGMKLRGHTFIWHNQLPAFARNIRTREEGIKVIEDTITQVLTRYKGKFYEYDVCNEIIDDETGGLRKTVWLDTIGPDYADIAFRIAKETDPSVKLILNDYSNEYAGTIKGDGFYNFVKGMVERGVPIDGVGFQLHLSTDYPLNEQALRKNIHRFYDLGLTVSFTEIDVRVKMPMTPQKEKLQKEIYEKLLRIALEEKVSCFVMWGYTDANSWVPGTFPGYGSAHPFDRQLKPKELYISMGKILAEYAEKNKK